MGDLGIVRRERRLQGSPGGFAVGRDDGGIGTFTASGENCDSAGDEMEAAKIRGRGFFAESLFLVSVEPGLF